LQPLGGSLLEVHQQRPTAAKIDCSKDRPRKHRAAEKSKFMMSPGLNSNVEPEADPNVSLGLDPAVGSGVSATIDSTIGSTTNSTVDLNPDAWRMEVAARLERYRTRRKPRSPRYPSLLLPFDAPESWSRSSVVPVTEADVTEREWPENQPSDSQYADSQYVDHHPPHAAPEPAELSAKVIEFPRSAALPTFHPSDLADPVFDYDLPRIVEAPEILPPPPALGGMLIEPARREQADARNDLGTAAPSASIARRGLAAAVDGAIVGVAVMAFAAIFIRLNSSLISGLAPTFNTVSNYSLSSILHAGVGIVLSPALSPLRAMLLVLTAALGVLVLLIGFAYEFLLIVYTGSTPGLRAARLRLAHFDGSLPDRRQRRWRVLASFLSALSAGLGYLWCVLDQNGLCWHDRITHTHVQSL
jgi:uncharacterized RDD family membrane protein YckC